MSDYDKENIGRILRGHGDWFGAQLLRLIAKADSNNQALLAACYPEQVASVLVYIHGKESNGG